MIRSLIRYFFPRRPVVVNTYRVKKCRERELIEAKTAQLAKEMNRPNPLGRA